MTGTTINSQVHELNGLRILPLPARPLRDARVIRIPNTDVVVAVDARGRVYSSQVSGPSRWWTDLTAGRMAYTTQGLIKLAVLSPKALKQHQELIERHKRIEDRRVYAKRLCEAAGKLGLPLTKTQLVKLELALGGGARARAIMAEALGEKVLQA